MTERDLIKCKLKDGRKGNLVGMQEIGPVVKISAGFIKLALHREVELYYMERPKEAA